MNEPDTFCSRCGTRHLEQVAYPRTCPGCGADTYANPEPVAVLIAPVGNGVVTIRRAIPPHVGALALPGGFHVKGESWREAAAREVLEETGQRYHPEDIRVMAPVEGWDPLFSTPNGALLMFLEAPRIHSRDLVTGHVDGETLETKVVLAPVELAFPAHSEALATFFRREERWGGPWRTLGTLPDADLEGQPRRLLERRARKHLGLGGPDELDLMLTRDGEAVLVLGRMRR